MPYLCLFPRRKPKTWSFWSGNTCGLDPDAIPIRGFVWGTSPKLIDAMPDKVVVASQPNYGIGYIKYYYY
jgi:hypothetical protein